MPLFPVHSNILVLLAGSETAIPAKKKEKKSNICVSSKNVGKVERLQVHTSTNVQASVRFPRNSSKTDIPPNPITADKMERYANSACSNSACSNSATDG